ncbi:hypothetical protein EDB83DRAFT_1038240 [Lactarius deliciosus]|nr:hypothetical protein EDB83DRAFT_1038240 [Lactarius deliciosus]
MGHSLALSDHSRTLMDLSTEFERSLSSRLDSVYELLDSQISKVFTASDTIWKRVSLIEGGLLSAMNSLMELSLSASHLSDALNSSAVEVKLMHIAQADAVRATARLAGTLQLMNETVMSALTDINTTAVKVNNTLGARSFPLYADILSSASAIVAYCEDDYRSLLIHLRCSRLTVSSEPDVFSTPGLPVSVVHFPQVVLSRCDALYRRRFLCAPRVAPKDPSGAWVRVFLSLSPVIPATLPTQAASWPRRRPFSWRSSQFSRIPDRLCRLLGD